MQLIHSLPTIVAPNGAFKLRPFDVSDIPALVKHINSSHIADRVSNVPSPYLQSDAESWFVKLRRERSVYHYANRIDFAIVVEGKLVGSVAFISIDGHKAQVSYWLGEDFHGSGIMTAAVRMLVEFGQKTCGFVRIWGYTYENNPASQAVLSHAGFKFEGISRKEWLKNGIYRDSHRFAIVV